MRKEIMEVIRANPDYVRYLREQPYWYRKLARDPAVLQQFDLSSKEYLGKTLPHKVSSFSQKLQMAQMMISMFQVMREND
ncbi:hypothetical protein FZW96_10000 [Bacillus sp. BGMRC 2118]|nr:hypothetical protein FZW96_10000 [Bacillus sp. BGMRC 2118]